MNDVLLAAQPTKQFVTAGGSRRAGRCSCAATKRRRSPARTSASTAAGPRRDWRAVPGLLIAATSRGACDTLLMRRRGMIANWTMRGRMSRRRRTARGCAIGGTLHRRARRWRAARAIGARSRAKARCSIPTRRLAARHSRRHVPLPRHQARRQDRRHCSIMSPIRLLLPHQRRARAQRLDKADRLAALCRADLPQRRDPSGFPRHPGARRRNAGRCNMARTRPATSPVLSSGLVPVAGA